MKIIQIITLISLITLNLGIAFAGPKTWNVTVKNPTNYELTFTIYTAATIGSSSVPTETYTLNVKHTGQDIAVQHLGSKDMPWWRQDVARCVQRINVQLPNGQKKEFTPENTSRAPCQNWNFFVRESKGPIGYRIPIVDLIN